MKEVKLYHHPSGYVLIRCKALGDWHLAKVLRSGKIKKHYQGGYSFKSNWRQAVIEIRKRNLKIPVNDWSRHYLSFENTVEDFWQAVIYLHKKG